MDRLGHTRILTAFTTSLLGLAALAALTGCDKRALFFDYDTDDSVARAELKISLDVDGGAMVGDVETKSVVTGTTMNEEGRTYGIIACEHESGTPTQFKTYDADNAGLYGNIKAWYGNYNSKGSYWWYSYEPTSTACFRPLYFITDNPSKHMDIYAYAPWKTGVTVLSGYDYALSSCLENDLVDLMYATYDDEECNPTNKNKEIVDGTIIPMSIQFHHALSRIVFHFRLANAQSTGLDGLHTLKLYQITINKTSSASTPLYTQGNMNIISGAVVHSGISQDVQKVVYAKGQTEGDSYIYPYDIYQSDVWKSYNMIVHPTEYQADGDFSLFFMFNAQTLIYQYDIKRSDLLHPDGTTYGFKPGYCYHFYFTIDNYIHLQNVVVNTDWELTDETELKV